MRRDQDGTLWEITAEIDAGAREGLVQRLSALPAVQFVGWSDRAVERHRGGKIEMRSRIGISTHHVALI